MKTQADKPSAKHRAATAITRVYCPPTTDPWRGLSTRSHDNPWVSPPEVTPETESLADVFDEGGRGLIAEVERGYSADELRYYEKYRRAFGAEDPGPPGRISERIVK